MSTFARALRQSLPRLTRSSQIAQITDSAAQNPGRGPGDSISEPPPPPPPLDRSDGKKKFQIKQHNERTRAQRAMRRSRDLTEPASHNHHHHQHPHESPADGSLLNSADMRPFRNQPARQNPDLPPWELRRQAANGAPSITPAAYTPIPNPGPSNQKKSDKRDIRSPPSKESGGIPDPTPAYLQLAALPPLRLAEPRKLLVVIDLNGTLLHRPHKRHPSRFVERPHARQFLSYCIDVFHVVIWSSAKPANVASMCNQLLTPEQRSKVVAVWGRDKFGLSPADFVARTQCYKRLHVLWADPTVAASHPDADRGVRWSQQNTVLIDDSLEKARSEPHNLIEIPEFSSDNVEVADILPQVHDYINECASQANVSSYMREKPFRAHPTSQLHLGVQAAPS